MKRVALIPSYQPTQTLIDLVQELYSHEFDIVVVDDGSGEAYRGIFSTADLYGDVISYEENHGKGYALKTGMNFIKAGYRDCVIVTMDGDGQHTVADAEKLCAEVENHPGEFVIGSRKLPKDAPTKSKFGNGITRSVYRSVTGLKVYDTQSGLRAFTDSWLNQLCTIRGDRYEYEMNVLLYIARKKLPVKEVPIETIYFDRQNSVSHFKAFSDSGKIYFEILKFSASSFLSFLLDYGLYALLIHLIGSLGPGLAIANYGARAISSVFNFTVNKRVVFKTQGNLAKETAKYFALVIFNITVNTVILSLFTYWGINVYFAKVIVEAIMFIFSFLIQHFFIFRKDRDEETGKEGNVLCEKNIS